MDSTSTITVPSDQKHPDKAVVTEKLALALSSWREGRWLEAEAQCRDILSIQAENPDAMHLLGIVLNDGGRFGEALVYLDQVLKKFPGSAVAHYNRGNSLSGLKSYQDALGCYDHAIRLRKGYTDALNNRGIIFLQLMQFKRALLDFDEVLKTDPRHAEALNNKALVLVKLKQHEAAAQVYNQLAQHHADYAYVNGNLFHQKIFTCNWLDYEPQRKTLNDSVLRGEPADMPFQFLAVSQLAMDQFICANSFVTRRYPVMQRVKPQRPLHHHNKIRIAYVSANFHRHALAQLLVQLFEIHDRSRFEVVAVSYGPPSHCQMRDRLVKAFDQFIDVWGKSAREIAQCISDLYVDVAVDLNGYTNGGLFDIFTFRPAPIQVSYMGYPGTLGSSEIDYIIADACVIPEGHDGAYAEKVVRLPDSYWVTDSSSPLPEHAPSRADVGLPDSGFVFCCFNNNYKITPDVFDIWMRLLHQVEGSVLWLLKDNDTAAINLCKEAVKRGIDPSRLVFAPRMPLSEHLARHRLADLFLDTLPVNAHTTASDALWAGLPVLTCTGEAFASRVAASLLHAIGLSDLVTNELGEYEVLALKLAREPEILGEVKARLAANRLTYPLFDTHRFCRHLEQAYVQMWERFQRGEPPQAFDVMAMPDPKTII